MFELKMNTDNDAFLDREATETSDILLSVAARIRAGELEGSVRDSNGNTIGVFSLDDRS